MKTNLDHYPRRVDANRHPKFKTLRVIYGGSTEGWAAEGRFWALNDIIGESEMCQLDLSKLRNKATIAETLGMSFEEFDHFIKVLSSPDIELIYEIKPGIYSTKTIQETLEIVLVERQKARDRRSSGEKYKSSGEKMEISDEQNDKVKESKVKESKGKERKGKESKVKETPFYVSENLPPLPSLPSQTFNGNGVSFNDDDSKEETKEKIDHMFKVYCNIPNPEKSTVTRVYNIIAKCPVPAVARSTVIQSFRNFFHLPDEKRNIPYLCSAIQGKINDELILYRERIAEKEKHNEKVIALDEDASRVIGSLVNKFGGQQL